MVSRALGFAMFYLKFLLINNDLQKPEYEIVLLVFDYCDHQRYRCSPKNFYSRSLGPAFFKIECKPPFVFKFAKFVPSKTFTVW